MESKRETGNCFPPYVTEEEIVTVLHECLYCSQGLLQDKFNYYTRHALSLELHHQNSLSSENNHLYFQLKAAAY